MKTYSYMALHDPSDYNIFSLVTIDAEYCKPKDESIIKYVSDKLGKDFIATAESDKTLYAMRDLEQLLGTKIIWVSGLSFEKLNLSFTGGNGLPNQQWRYCTTELKMRPIWDWWYKNINEKIRMGIGFRYDEKERADRFSTIFKGITGKRGTRNRWEEIEWRDGYFPLIENRINNIDVVKWAFSSGLKFPPDSNCVGCFHKPIQQLRKNFDEEPMKMRWFSEQETEKKRWKKEMMYNQVKGIGLQMDFFFGTGSGCDAGYCTD